MTDIVLCWIFLCFKQQLSAVSLLLRNSAGAEAGILQSLHTLLDTHARLLRAGRALMGLESGLYASSAEQHSLNLKDPSLFWIQISPTDSA